MADIELEPLCLPGAIVYLYYGVAGEPWHERFMLNWVGHGDYVVLTPYGDRYVESLNDGNISTLKEGTSDCALPLGLGAGAGCSVYRLNGHDRVTTLAACETELAAGHLIARAARLALGARYGNFPPLVRTTAAVAAVGLPVSDAIVPAGGTDYNWLVVAAGGSYVASDQVTTAEDGRVSTTCGFFVWTNFSSIALFQRLPASEAPAFIKQLRTSWSPVTLRDPGGGSFSVLDSEANARTLPVARNASGECVRGVRSVAESLVRQLQFAEHEVQCTADKEKTADGSEYFLGRQVRTGGALVPPQLMDWVAQRASRESTTLKEQLKAAEGRRLVGDMQ